MLLLFNIIIFNCYLLFHFRTGLNAKLIIREDLDQGNIKENTVEQTLDGPNSIFNLDKNQSKLCIGSCPLNYKMQDSININSFDGEMEELVIGDTPVSLWNFNYGLNIGGANHR